MLAFLVAILRAIAAIADLIKAWLEKKKVDPKR